MRYQSICAALIGLGLTALTSAACSREAPPTPPVATPSISLSRDRAPLGSPLDITYKFVVAGDAAFTEDYRVMLHVVDADDELMWTDDHDPPTPTTQWKPGQTIEYTRTVFVPIYPYVGEASLHIGMYSPRSQIRLTLQGEDVGQRAYRAGRLQLQPQSENVFTIFKEGWHPAEVAEHNASVQWQWTKKQATLAFKNPQKDATFYLSLDNPGGVFNENQQVTVSLNNAVVDQFEVTPRNELLRRIPLKADQMGAGEMSELQVTVDKTFVPMQIPGAGSKDPRELGVRVFHAFIQPAS
ncbi:MAG TPA: hypothetical protein VM818_11020 [Vicinamibacterales bacterium]|nr:hypothetical protein [Vicinamibacterales bacterium]